MEHSDLVFVNVTVTCHSENCENKDISIDISIVDGSSVICGPCGVEITDVIPTAPPVASKKK